MFWVSLSILAAIVIAMLIVLILVTVEYTNFRNAYFQAVYNTNECTLDAYKCQYVDNDFPRPTSFPDAFSKEIALFSGQLVWNLEYFETNGTLNIPTGLTLIGEIDTIEKDAPLFCAIYLDEENRVIYVTIRGTMTEKEWKWDLNFKQGLLDQQGVFNTSDNLYFECAPATRVHAGFLYAFQQIRDDLKEIIEQHESSADNIVVSGHSLGAATASLTALYLASNVTTLPITVYAFGKPRVGNVDYSECVGDHFGNRFPRRRYYRF